MKIKLKGMEIWVFITDMTILKTFKAACKFKTWKAKYLSQKWNHITSVVLAYKYRSTACVTDNK